MRRLQLSHLHLPIWTVEGRVVVVVQTLRLCALVAVVCAGVFLVCFHAGYVEEKTERAA